MTSKKNILKEARRVNADRGERSIEMDAALAAPQVNVDDAGFAKWVTDPGHSDMPSIDTLGNKGGSQLAGLKPKRCRDKGKFIKCPLPKPEETR